eukprot:SAG31_NODE_1790_length_7264_cov_3.356455_7_plen_164_part_00
MWKAPVCSDCATRPGTVPQFAARNSRRPAHLPASVFETKRNYWCEECAAAHKDEAGKRFRPKRPPKDCEDCQKHPATWGLPTTKYREPFQKRWCEKCSKHHKGSISHAEVKANYAKKCEVRAPLRSLWLPAHSLWPPARRALCLRDSPLFAGLPKVCVVWLGI